jgi:small subunit ribosomal protein S13
MSVQLFGVRLDYGKLTWIALTGIFGIGRTSAIKICSVIGIPLESRVKELTEDEIDKIRKFIVDNFTIEIDLRNEKISSIKRLIEINSYRGRRHNLGLPVRGQRTKTNARTRKGKRKP